MDCGGFSSLNGVVGRVRGVDCRGFLTLNRVGRVRGLDCGGFPNLREVVRIG